MKAHVIETFGTPDVFKPAELPHPRVQPGHVTVQVKASSINPLDCKIRSGIAGGYCPIFPAKLHGDVSGIVDDVGEGVNRFQPGDEVYGFSGGVKSYQGALADYMLADSRLLARKPKNLSFKEAAVLPLVTLTAWEALFDRADLQPGEHILIYGGTGGVGHIALQLAKWRGAKVYVTCSTAEKANIARSLGADEIIDPHHESVEAYVAHYTNGAGFDVVFDTWGFENLDNALKAARVRGRVLNIMSFSTHDLTPMLTKGLSLHVINMLMPLIHGKGRKAQGDILEKISELVESDIIQPLLDKQTFTFNHINEAHQYFESGQAIGKVALLHNNPN